MPLGVNLLATVAATRMSRAKQSGMQTRFQQGLSSRCLLIIIINVLHKNCCSPPFLCQWKFVHRAVSGKHTVPLLPLSACNLSTGTGKSDGDRHPKISDNVLIGAGATILGNITVGKGAMVASGSLVLKPVPSKTMVAGSPAKEVGQLTGECSTRAEKTLLRAREIVCTTLLPGLSFLAWWWQQREAVVCGQGSVGPGNVGRLVIAVVAFGRVRLQKWKQSVECNAEAWDDVSFVNATGTNCQYLEVLWEATIIPISG